MILLDVERPWGGGEGRVVGEKLVVLFIIHIQLI